MNTGSTSRFGVTQMSSTLTSGENGKSVSPEALLAICGSLWHCARRVTYGLMSVFSSLSWMRPRMCCVSCSAWVSSAAGCAQAALSAQALVSMLSRAHFSTQLSHPQLIPLHHPVSLTFPDSRLFSTLTFSVLSLCEVLLHVLILHFLE